jgi:Na+-transporting methylmalonyl-CoA/oxaloacetate decarboxylase beta subunit
VSEILDFLTNAKIMELASDTRVLFGVGLLFILAVLFRWKFVLLLLFALGGTLAVIRYANLESGQASLDNNLITFGIGTLAVACVLIYFLFIRSD